MTKKNGAGMSVANDGGLLFDIGTSLMLFQIVIKKLIDKQ